MRKLLLLVALVVLVVFPVAAQGDAVERLYFVDIVQTGIYRSPDHFGGRVVAPDAELVGVQWVLVDYGLVNQGLVAATVDSTQQAYLAGLADVLTIPLDLETVITGSAVNALRNDLEAREIPATWVNNGDTYRIVLREVIGYFYFMQRLTAITGSTPAAAGVALNTQFQNMPQIWQDGILQTAIDLVYDASTWQGTTNFRAILRNVASQNGSKVFTIGSTQL